MDLGKEGFPGREGSVGRGVAMGEDLAQSPLQVAGSWLGRGWDGKSKVERSAGARSWRMCTHHQWGPDEE